MADEKELWKDVADSKKKEKFNEEKIKRFYFTFLLSFQTQSFESLKYWIIYCHHFNICTMYIQEKIFMFYLKFSLIL